MSPKLSTYGKRHSSQNDSPVASRRVEHRPRPPSGYNPSIIATGLADGRMPGGGMTLICWPMTTPAGGISVGDEHGSFAWAFRLCSVFRAIVPERRRSGCDAILHNPSGERRFGGPTQLAFHWVSERSFKHPPWVNIAVKSVLTDFTQWVCHIQWIVLPLTLLSAYLIFWKPRKRGNGVQDMMGCSRLLVFILLANVGQCYTLADDGAAPIKGDVSSPAAISKVEYACLEIGVDVRYDRRAQGWTLSPIPETPPILGGPDARQRGEIRGDARGRRNFLKALPRLTELRPIYSIELVPANLFTDADIEKIVETLPLESLERFRVESIHISESVSRLLKASPRLRTLDLSNTDVGASNSQDLSRMKELKCLRLSNTRFDDAAMKGLDGELMLELLDLEQTNVSDDGIAVLVKQPGLRRLNLAQTRVSDACVPLLSQLTRLQELDLRGTGVTEAGVKELRESLPNCRILNTLERH